MATRELVEWVCDLCDVVGDVKTHQVVLDGRRAELEACEPCWTDPAAVFEKLARAGRKIPRQRSKR